MQPGKHQSLINFYTYLMEDSNSLSEGSLTRNRNQTNL